MPAAPSSIARCSGSICRALRPRSRSFLDPDPTGKATSVRLAWESLTADEPLAVSLTFDGQQLRVEDPRMFTLPEHDPRQFSPAACRARFSGQRFGSVGDDVRWLLRRSGEQRAPPLSHSSFLALAIHRPSTAAFAIDGEALPVIAIEKGPAEVAFVRDLRARRPLLDLARQLAFGRNNAITLKKNQRARVVWADAPAATAWELFVRALSQLAGLRDPPCRRSAVPGARRVAAGGDRAAAAGRRGGGRGHETWPRATGAVASSSCSVDRVKDASPAAPPIWCAATWRDVGRAAIRLVVPTPTSGALSAVAVGGEVRDISGQWRLGLGGCARSSVSSSASASSGSRASTCPRTSCSCRSQRVPEATRWRSACSAVLSGGCGQRIGGWRPR